jgi:hypothetical protein
MTGQHDTLPRLTRRAHLQEAVQRRACITPLVACLQGKYHLCILLLCCLITAFTATAMRSEVVGLDHDDGIYTILGKSLYEGKGLRLSSLPSSPYQAKYPIVYPFLLSLSWYLAEFPQNIFFIKLLNVIFLFFILLETYHISMIFLKSRSVFAIFLTLLVGTSIFVTHLATSALSEIPYMFFSLTSICLFLRIYRQEETHKKYITKYLFYSCFILFVSLSFQTRSIGLSLLLTSIFCVYMRERVSTSIFFIFFIALLNLPWTLWAARHTTSQNISPLLDYYTDYASILVFNSLSGLPMLGIMLLKNILYLYDHTAVIISNISSVFKPLMVIIWLVLLCGAWQSRRDKCDLFLNLYLVAYLFIYLCSPSVAISGLRYLIPIMPLLLIIFFRGVVAVDRTLARVFSGERPRLYFRALVILLLLPNCTASIAQHTRRQQRPVADGFMETIAWIKEHTDEHAIVACVYDPVYHLYTGRLTLRPWVQHAIDFYYPLPHAVGDPDDALTLLKTLRVDYVIAEPLAGLEEAPVMRFFAAMLARHQDELTLVFVSHDQHHRMYRIHY